MSLRALFAASTGMEAQQLRIDNIANDLSNLNTTGFKSSRESFEDLIYDQIQTPGLKNSANTPSPVGIQVGHGTRLVGVYKNFSQGEFSQTGRDLDIALEGAGFLTVIQENGDKAYTRDGNLKVDATGKLVNNSGLLIEPAITIPSDTISLTIGKDGLVSVVQAGTATPLELGNIQVSIFQNPAGLKSLGQNLFKETIASGVPTAVTPGASGSGTFAQGFLENSNVNVAEELINMIIAQRTYEANSKVLSVTNEMMRASNNVV